MLLREKQETAAAFLKQETATSHEELEAIVAPMLQHLKTLDDYETVLRLFYGFFKPVEDRINKQLGEDWIADAAERRKADWLLADLTFSKPHTTLPEATSLPQIGNRAQAIGALYVLEGSTLGGRGISRMLLQHPALHLSEKQLQFFSGYGAATGQKWTAFVSFLNQQAGSRQDLQDMTAAANETFILFKNWILEHAT